VGHRGQKFDGTLRAQITLLLHEAVARGARRKRACEVIGISVRTLERWEHSSTGIDNRKGPGNTKHALTKEEKDKIVALANTPECRNLSPEQVIAVLADRGVYICSARSLRRILKERGQDRYRQRAKPPTPRSRPSECVATGPLEVLSWDITYLRNSRVRGSYFYLYIFIDIWSRRILCSEVHEAQDVDLAAELLNQLAEEHGVTPNQTVLHSDNGGPMKGATILATMRSLGIQASFSRPGVSDDNPFIEALFRHMKYAPRYPAKGFDSLEQAREWVKRFVHWYNHQHLHSSIGYVTPDDRHHGRDIEMLQRRAAVFAEAKRTNPARWSRHSYAWTRVQSVILNPERCVSIVPNRVAA
jgi:putative transposase